MSGKHLLCFVDRSIILDMGGLCCKPVQGNQRGGGSYDGGGEKKVQGSRKSRNRDYSVQSVQSHLIWCTRYRNLNELAYFAGPSEEKQQ